MPPVPNAGSKENLPLSKAPLVSLRRGQPVCGDTRPLPKITADAWRGGSFGSADAYRKQCVERGHSLGQTDESLAHIRIPPGRSPEGALAEGSCPAQECGAG
jgi:hypothetical protein